MTSFKYLRRLLTVMDDDWPEVIVNLQKAQKIWARLSMILGREGAYPRLRGRFYLAVFQAVLLFGVETWVVTPLIGRLLGSFRHRVARSMAGMQLRRQTNGGWA